MNIARSFIKKRKGRSSSLETRSSSFDRGVANMSPRSSVESTARHRSRSVDSRKATENHSSETMIRKKRKIEVLQSGSNTLNGNPSKALSYVRRRNNKAARNASFLVQSGASQKKAGLRTRPPEHRDSLRAAKSLVSRSRSESAGSGIEVELDLGYSQRSRSERESRQEDQHPFGEESEAQYLKERLVELQKEANQARRTIEEQHKAMDELKKDLASSKKVNRKQGNQIDKLKSSSKKAEDRLQAIHESLQCHICLEMLSKPHVLVPCGHIFCQGCLQNWFRSAASQGENNSTGLPTIWRLKTCPSCRSKILGRPVPSFILNDILSTLPSTDQSVAESISIDGDPWNNIFPTEIDFSEFERRALVETDDYESDDDSSLSSTGDSFLDLRRFLRAGGAGDSDSDSDDDSETSSINSAYFRETRTPPYSPAHLRNRITRRMYPHMSREHLQLLQRGVTHQMIESYDMRFDTDEGIVAWIDEDIEVYLGWNIVLRDNEAPDGRTFMAWVEKDMHENPDRWSREEGEDHTVVRRLVYQWRSYEMLGPTSEDELVLNDDSDEGDIDSDIEYLRSP